MDKELIYEALRRGIIDEDEARRRLNADRVKDDLTQVYVGGARAGRNLLGLPGDIETLGTAKGTRGEASLAGERSVRPDFFPTSKQVGDWFGNLTGKSLPEPQYPEGKYIASTAEGMASMLSPNKGALATGALSGFLGEGAEQLMKGGRLIGNVAGLVPSIVKSLLRPWDVKAFRPWLERIGPEKVWQGNVDQTIAAKALDLPNTNISAQVPQLKPTFDWLKGTTSGKPLAELDARTAEALRNTDLTDTSRWGPTTGDTLVKLMMRRAETDPLPGMPAAIERGAKTTPIDWTQAIPWNPLRFAVERVGDWRASSRLSDLAKKLASPDAGDYLNSFVHHSITGEVSQALAKALLSEEIQRDKPPLRIDITGGNQAE